MGYVMDSDFFPLTFCIILHLSLLFSLSLSCSLTRNPLVGGMEPFLASFPHTTLARLTADPPLRGSLSLTLPHDHWSLSPTMQDVIVCLNVSVVLGICCMFWVPLIVNIFIHISIGWCMILEMGVIEGSAHFSEKEKEPGSSGRS